MFSIYTFLSSIPLICMCFIIVKQYCIKVKIEKKKSLYFTFLTCEESTVFGRNVALRFYLI